MFELIKKMFVRLLISRVNASNHTNCVLLNNHKCMTQHTLISYILMNTVKNFTIIHLWLN